MWFGLGGDGKSTYNPEKLLTLIKTPNPERILYLKDAIKEGYSSQEIFDISGVDPWFLRQLEEIIAVEAEIVESMELRHCIVQHAKSKGIALPFSQVESHADGLEPLPFELQESRDLLWRAKQTGFSDRQVGWLTKTGEDAARACRLSLDIRPAFKCVDTCGGEFQAETPYYYSTYEKYNESVPPTK